MSKILEIKLFYRLSLRQYLIMVYLMEMQKISEAAAFIASKCADVPKFAVILGSGLGIFADQLEQQVIIAFEDVPHFPLSTVEGHQGRIVAGRLGTVPVLILQGRFHYYEGYSMDQVVFPLRCLLQLGVKNLLVTNAAGSVDSNYRPGDLMLIRDHIKLQGENPLRGRNLEQFGPRFSDMSEPYSRDIRALAKKCAAEEDIELKEGVYYYMTGPSYETASEVKAINILGANVVGMSTVPEVIVAAHGKMKVLGVSCITNMGTGLLDQALDHAEVIKTGEMVGERFIRLLTRVLLAWDKP